MTVEILKKKIELVKQSRIEFIKKHFSIGQKDVLINRNYDYDVGPSLQIPTWVDEYLIKKLKIKKKEKDICVQFRISYDNHNIFRQATTMINHDRKSIYDMDYDYWVILQRYLSELIKDRQILLEMFQKREEDKKKKELCRLTKCYSKELATLICDCGWVNPPDALFCAECGIKLT